MIARQREDVFAIANACRKGKSRTAKSCPSDGRVEGEKSGEGECSLHERG